MGALCDPSTADVTGRILEAFGLMINCAREEDVAPGGFLERLQVACDRGIAFLSKAQEGDGAWYGRWGSNYVYGTSNVLCGLVYFQDESDLVCSMVRRGVAWLKNFQNADGGWGEELITYSKPELRGIGPSTASQMAWGLMGLLTWCDPGDESVRRAVEYLCRTQDEKVGEGASWPERLFTGTGFPGHFYLSYTLYRHYFPMMALGRWVKAVKEKREKGGGY